MATFDDLVTKLLASRATLVKLRREYAAIGDGEGVARYQLAIEAVDRAIIDEHNLQSEIAKPAVTSPKPEVRVSDDLY